MLRFRGFTIVELLIVIVVIAILAAISVAAYSNISNRANDSTVKNDLSNLAKQIKLIQVDSGNYPAGSRLQTSSTVGSGGYFDVPGVSFSPAKDSYLHPTGAGDANFAYCTGPELASGGSGFRLLARSKSGSTFGYSSAAGIEARGLLGIGELGVCSGLGYPRSYAFGYSSSTGWQEWTE